MRLPHDHGQGGVPLVDHGSYIRPSDEREIPRYRCRHCGRTFSQQTFSCTYWLKRRELLPRIGAQLVAGSCLRQIGRTVSARPSTAERHVRDDSGATRIGLMTKMLVALREE
ncbi:MAG: hypothetical protein HC882_03505, partial [Acidobacteria bacterium]|nr:hypothetical protein [Acidobacteriota bacterium]